MEHVSIAAPLAPAFETTISEPTARSTKKVAISRRFRRDEREKPLRMTHDFVFEPPNTRNHFARRNPGASTENDARRELVAITP
jgi:hypothetical protein